jgi:hypothetical protein
MLSKDHIPHLAPSGHYTVDGKRDTVGAVEAAAAIEAGRSVQPANADVARQVAVRAAGPPLAGVLARVFGFDVPDAPPEAPAPKRVDGSLRARLGSAMANADEGQKRAALRALAAELGVTAFDSTSIAEMQKGIRAELDKQHGAFVAVDDGMTQTSVDGTQWKADPETESARVHELVKAAGDDVPRLQSLAAQYRVDISQRWGAKRVAAEITRAVAERLAGGDKAAG